MCLLCVPRGACRYGSGCARARSDVGRPFCVQPGDQIAFEGPKGCIYTGAVDVQRLVVIEREICPSGTRMVTMVVPLDRQRGVTQTPNSNIFRQLLTESSRNYYLFPAEAIDSTPLGR